MMGWKDVCEHRDFVKPANKGMKRKSDTEGAGTGGNTTRPPPGGSVG